MTEPQTSGVPDGWTRVYVQLPLALAEMMRIAGQDVGHGGMKVLATAAVALFLALPREEREQVLDYVLVNTRRHPNLLDVDGVLKTMNDAREKAGRATHYVDRILDPDILAKKKKPAKRREDAA